MITSETVTKSLYFKFYIIMFIFKYLSFNFFEQDLIYQKSVNSGFLRNFTIIESVLFENLSFPN